ncbi:MAG TPA: 4-phosphoerythronate dehydrogenase PdxB [Gemmatimonadaceae bacterium]|jgi:erythronate-4-phosphate dehydrogenase
MTTPRALTIVVDDKIPFLRGVLEPYATVVYRDGRRIAPDDVRDADALIVRTRTVCGPALLADSRVRFIASATIGHDHIDTAFCAARGIAWTNAAGCNAASVQQYMGSVLAHRHRAHGLRLRGRTMGIVGVGHVGRRVEQLARALGMRVLRNDPPRERDEGDEGFVSLDELWETADVITLHVPLTRTGRDATVHLADAARLGQLRPDQVLINTSRGEVVDTTALAATLKRRPLAAIVLDVWENEPAIDRELMRLVSLATPHIAGYSADGKANGTAMSVQAISRAFGLPLNAWTPPDLPAPPSLALHEDCRGREPEDVLCSLMLATYDPLGDDRALRASPETFEEQRTAHPLRRDWPVWAVTLTAPPSELIERVSSLGFRSVTSAP